MREFFMAATLAALVLGPRPASAVEYSYCASGVRGAGGCT